MAHVQYFKTEFDTGVMIHGNPTPTVVELTTSEGYVQLAASEVREIARMLDGTFGEDA